MKKVIILAVFLIIFVGVGGLVYYGQWREKTAKLYYSGTIEATESNLSFQVSGRVKKIFVDDGFQVEKGQILAELENEEYVTACDQAKAAVNQARETLNKLKMLLSLYRVSLPQAVKRAEANVRALEAKVKELEKGFRSQEIQQSRKAMEAAKAIFLNAKKDKTRFDKLYKQGLISQKERDDITLRYETALREYESAKERLSLLEEGYRIETIRAAKARLAEAIAAEKQARSNLRKIEMTQKDILAAKAQVEQAEAAFKLANIHLEYTRLRAPFAGIVTSRNVEPGEVVSPAREVISLANLKTVDLKIFVGEPEIGKIKPGQRVTVKIDTFPHKSYTGRVTYISPEAEFTPKIIQTHKERVKLVYLVKVTIPNPELELKSGMPADAWFE